jgi:hypothetical protein
MLAGQKQNELRTDDTPQNAALDLYYCGQALVNVRGPVTGSAYEFSAVQPVQPVDLKDARFLLANPLFTLSR